MTTTLHGCSVAISGGDDCSVRLWDLATGEQIGQPLTGHTESVTAVATALLGDTPVAVTGSNDCTIRLWNLTTGKQLRSPFTFPFPVKSVAATGDQLLVAFGPEIAALTIR
jgi:WD40 repeat protein